MKYVVVPEPVEPFTMNGDPMQEQTFDADGKPTTRKIGQIDLHRYLMTYVINETKALPPAQPNHPQQLVAKIGVGYEGNRRCRKLDKAFEGKRPGDVVAVEDKDHEVVASIIRERTWPNTYFSMQLADIEGAWLDAKDKAPETAAQ